MLKLQLIPIKESDIVVASALEIMRGGSVTSCGLNDCKTNTGSCEQQNECGNNNTTCTINKCTTNLICTEFGFIKPCKPNTGCGSVSIQ